MIQDVILREMRWRMRRGHLQRDTAGRRVRTKTFEMKKDTYGIYQQVDLGGFDHYPVLRIARTP
jgi:hypothetical protein